ncbi:unannotated protein [freshwater metagenome]|uniref:Unannotated protein n=1 Tax=freshwater metagenome TaxID=449393 RepID=A0A6J6B1V8_9ZZZZ
MPLGASGIRHATVRIKKLVKLGTTTAARITAFHFSATLNAAKYATGNPIKTHKKVARTEIRKVARKVLKNVSSNTAE